MLEGQRRELRVEGGDLDRNDLQLRELQRSDVRIQAPPGLGFSQEGLAQKVDVHPHTVLSARLQVPDQQSLLGRENDVGGLFPHPFPDQGGRHAREVAAEGAKAPEEGSVQAAEETRDSLQVQDVQNLVDRAVRAVGAEGLVSELGERRLVVGTLHHPIEFGLLPLFDGGLKRRRRFLKLPCQDDGFLRRLRVG